MASYVENFDMNFKNASHVHLFIFINFEKFYFIKFILLYLIKLIKHYLIDKELLQCMYLKF